MRAIPTQVGNTMGFSHLDSGMAGHPHAGGEYRMSRERSYGLFGPSPRRWGIQQFRLYIAFGDRAIPTQVGNTPLVV